VTIREQFSAGFANSPAAGGPFTLLALPLAAIEFADRNVVRNIAHDVALHELHQPMEGLSPQGTVFRHPYSLTSRSIMTHPERRRILLNRDGKGAVFLLRIYTPPLFSGASPG
jgi:hypothetical protein